MTMKSSKIGEITICLILFLMSSCFASPVEDVSEMNNHVPASNPMVVKTIDVSQELELSQCLTSDLNVEDTGLHLQVLVLLH